MLRFADGIALLTENEKELESMLNDMGRVLVDSYGLRINKDKTKCSRSDTRN